MSSINQNYIQRLLRRGTMASTAKAKGDAFEDLICYLFKKIPGISVTRRNQRNVYESEEIDIAFWNEKNSSGVPFLPWVILVECKNWSSPVGAEQVSWFDSKMRNRGAEFGILVAVYGVTGDPLKLTAAHNTIATSLREGRRLIIITSDEIKLLRDSSTLILLIKEKICELIVSGTVA